MRILLKIVIRLFYLNILLLFFLQAQDSNIKYPLQEIEKMLLYDPVEISIPRDVRFKGDKAKTAILKRDDGFFIRVKIKQAAQGGENYNNQPRYEIAAYKLQHLFLEPENFVVPPTAGRGFSPAEYEKIEPNASPTFENCPAIYCLLQYWLDNVTAKEILDEKRFASDSIYAKHIGNLNIFTYLIRHSDSNIGNFLISTDSLNPRVFAVDNEMAFGDITSERGYEWRNLVVKRFPQETVAQLRQVELEDLHKILGVVAQYEIREERLAPVEPTEPIDITKGVRQAGGVIQLGLTEKEINGVYKRLKEFLDKADSGEIETF
jgi:hypothetical protein